MEEIIYTVHSDVDEQNISKEFWDKEDAIEYAKANAVDETWVEKLVLLYDDNNYLVDESTPEVVWAYDNEDYEEDDDFYDEDDYDSLNEDEDID